MNWQAAKAAMRWGKRVRYKSWWWGRYIQMIDGFIVHEDGRLASENGGFENGKLSWEIYDEQKHGAHNEKGDQGVR